MTIENASPTSPSRRSPLRLVAIVGGSLIVIGSAALAVRTASQCGVRGLLAFASNGSDEIARGRHQPRRVYVGVGTVANNSGVGGSELSQVAQSAMLDALQQHTDITLDRAAAAPATRGARVRTEGHHFDANIQSIRRGENSMRVTVSVVVSSDPAREYEFESSSSITITGGSANTPEAQQDAVRRSVRSAADRAVAQLTQGS